PRLEYLRDLRRNFTELSILIKKNRVCECCGNSPVEFDHIIPAPLYRQRNGHIGGLSAQNSIPQFERGNLQFLCRTCNLSKGDSTNCKVHLKYLGLWNHLPILESFE